VQRTTERLCGAALAGVLLLPAAAPAEDAQVPAPELGDWEQWQPLSLPRVDEATVYTPVTEGGRSAVRSESRCSASALARSLEGADLSITPILRWSWKIERALAARDERAKAGDDFAARVYVMFRFRPDRASWTARARHRIGRLLYGRDVPGNALNYVWSTREPAGASWDNPFTADSKMISMGPAPSARWRSHEVDLVSDYRDRFGAEPPEPLALAIMTDADNSCSEAGAWFASFALLPRAESE